MTSPSEHREIPQALEWSGWKDDPEKPSAFTVTMDFSFGYKVLYRPTYRGKLPRAVERRESRWWRRRRGRAIRKMRREGTWLPPAREEG